MKKKRITLTPAVDKRVLLLLAGVMWLGVGLMLVRLAWAWLSAPGIRGAMDYAGAGIAAALVIHHFGFLKIVDKNLGRILPLEGKRCVFSFMSWKSYVMVAVMIAMGVLLRHSSIPKSWLSVLYIGIGLSLVLSSIRYLRVLIGQLRHTG
ncbi:MAG: hypothetical protein ABIL58_17450 [Pseudomonadota bacterium]